VSAKKRRELVWIDAHALRLIHDETVAEHGGASGLRDAGLLESALTRARNAWCYGEDDLFVLAALYGGGVVKNHPFTDGNKRAGFLAAVALLELNRLRFSAGEADAAAQTLALAAGEIGAEAFAAWLKANAEPR
jgi:death-on-curing protein